MGRRGTSKEGGRSNRRKYSLALVVRSNISIIVRDYLPEARYEKKYVQKKKGGTVYSFTCAQSDHREHKPKVPRGKARDTERMKRFPCQGTLYVTILEGRQMVIKLKHLHHHVPYFDIALPDRWKAWIEENASHMLPGPVRRLCVFSFQVLVSHMCNRCGSIFCQKNVEVYRSRKLICPSMRRQYGITG